jgi:hypothetical protein
LYVPDRPAADFNGGAGGIRDVQKIGPEVVAKLRGKRRIDLEVRHTGRREAPQKRLHEAATEPDLIDQAIKPSAFAVVLGAHGKPF